MEKLSLPLTIKVFKEGTSKSSPYVAYNPEFDVSSCGKTEGESRKMLEAAIYLVLEGAREDGTFDQLMQEAGFGDYRKEGSEPRTYISVFNFPFSSSSRSKFSYA